MASKPVTEAFKQARPILSVSQEEAKRRVIILYKTWYRLVPETIVWYSLPITVKQGRVKLKQEFMKNKDISDIRLIDMLVIKGQMELKEIVKRWKQSCHVMYKFQDTAIRKPTNFLAKFLSGND